MDKPSIGRIVHFVAPSASNERRSRNCRAAIITEVKDAPNEAHSGIVDLCVFNSTGSQHVLDVPYVLAERNIGGTWHWPERVG